MHPYLAPLAADLITTGSIARDAGAFLEAAGRPEVARHSERVAGLAACLARRFGADSSPVATAAWLHDAGKVWPPDDRLTAALMLGIDVLPQERACPSLIHQKLSAVLARELVGVTDAEALAAIGCHTTLRAGASLVDRIVFAADKLAGDPAPYQVAMGAAAETSLDGAVYVYLDYVWRRRFELEAVHPWLLAAHRQLARQLGPEAPDSRG